MLVDIGPAIIELAAGRMFCPNYNVGWILMILKEPTDTPLPLRTVSPESNEMIQALASSNVKGVHAAINSFIIRNVQPALGVRSNSVTTTGYISFNFTTNPIFDLIVTTASKFLPWT